MHSYQLERMQQGIHGRILQASVCCAKFNWKVLWINYKNFHCFFLSVSEPLLTEHYILSFKISDIFLNFLSGKPEKRMTLFCPRNKGSLNLNRTHVVDLRVMLKKTCCFKLLRTITAHPKSFTFKLNAISTWMVSFIVWGRLTFSSKTNTKSRNESFSV